MSWWETLLISVATGAVTGIISWIVTKIKNNKVKYDALERAVQSMLRRNLMRDHDKYIDLGYCSAPIKEYIEANYKSYKELGGNGVVDKMYNDILSLPEKPKGEEQ